MLKDTTYCSILVRDGNYMDLKKSMEEREVKFEELRGLAIKAIEELDSYVAYSPGEGSVESAVLIIKNIKLCY